MAPSAHLDSVSDQLNKKTRYHVMRYDVYYPEVLSYACRFSLVRFRDLLMLQTIMNLC